MLRSFASDISREVPTIKLRKLAAKANDILSKPRLKGQGFDPAFKKELVLLLLQVFPPSPA
jgi:hypothetical protein